MVFQEKGKEPQRFSSLMKNYAILLIEPDFLTLIGAISMY